MNTQETGSNRNWRKIAIPATLVAGLAAGALFSPIGIASADDDTTDADTSEASSNDDASKEQRSEEKTAKKAERAEAVAGILGISTDELEAGREEGKTLAQLASENGVEREQLVSSLTELAEARIDEAVSSGKLDEEKAAEIREALAEKIEAKVDQAPGEGKDGSSRGMKSEGKNRSDGEGRSDRETKDQAGETEESDTVDS